FDMAVNATKMGAYDFLTKPFKTDVLIHTVGRAVEDIRLRTENESLRARSGDPHAELLGDSSVMSQLRNAIDKVAPTESRVLIGGPAGSGKGVVASVLHAKSLRKNGPFVTLSCAGLEPLDLDRALFGHEASGDQARRVGALEKAHGGTLVLDEIGDMPVETQAKLVRVLHKPEFTRIEGHSVVDVDVRVVATSNRDLGAAIADGSFREDLFYRLSVVPLQVPPLSDRLDDIPALAEDIMHRSATSTNRPPRSFSADALAALQAHHWPGNVWELVNVVQRLLLLSDVDITAAILADDVTKAIGTGNNEDMTGEAVSFELMNVSLRQAREAFERQYLNFQLTRFGGNISKTANFVGMDRAALHRKLKSLGLHGGDKNARRAG
ncbi:MAG TPA: sigma-54-dependent Fis family transcriptional regulator, partial [Rhodospirillaceae bacterium]|nr:sigma-54-dependent Fis family transcriptional regulator [Rhodospirillaceae bacterium]